MIDTINVQIWLASMPVDMRKSFDTLAEMVRAFLGQDPLSGNLFVFRNRSGERLKILWWDRNGLVLYYKRLERGTFAFPSDPSGRSICIDSAQLMRLLQGMRIVLQIPAVRPEVDAAMETKTLAGAAAK